MTGNTVLGSAIERIKRWMLKNNAPLLVENLAGPATDEYVTELQTALGFAVPEQLVELWRIHNGQLNEGNGFIEHLDLLGTHWSRDANETVQAFVEVLREDDKGWSEAQVTPEEINSTQWVAFAAQGSELLVVSALSGRVFSCGKDWPPLHLKAGSLAEWFAHYADRVEADDYKVEEGFGDYYLSLRDRQREQLEQERAQKRAADEKYQRETPALTQLQDAISAAKEDRCRDVFARMAADKNPEQLTKAVELLFSAKAEPKLVATALQYVLSDVTLTQAQWLTVAKGGALLENNALADLANARARSAEPAKKPWWRFW